MDLKQLCQEIVKDLESFDFLEHVGGNAGLLLGDTHYRAIFLFKPKEQQTQGKMYQLIGFLKEQYYQTNFSFKEHEAVKVTREKGSKNVREEKIKKIHEFSVSPNLPQNIEPDLQIKTGLWMLVLTAKDNTPREQEDSLIYDLHALKRNLGNYKQKRHIA